MADTFLIYLTFTAGKQDVDSSSPTGPTTSRKQTKSVLFPGTIHRLYLIETTARTFRSRRTSISPPRPRVREVSPLAQAQSRASQAMEVRTSDRRTAILRLQLSTCNLFLPDGLCQTAYLSRLKIGNSRRRGRIWSAADCRSGRTCLNSRRHFQASKVQCERERAPFIPGRAGWSLHCEWRGGKADRTRKVHKESLFSRAGLFSKEWEHTYWGYSKVLISSTGEKAHR